MGYLSGSMAMLAFPWDELQRLDLRAALDILLIAAVIYYFLSLMRGTRAAQMAIALGVIVSTYYAARWARLEMVEWLLTTVVPYLTIALIVLFQPEIRQALASAGRNPFWRIFSGQNPTEAHDDVVAFLDRLRHLTGRSPCSFREISGPTVPG